MNRHLVYPGQIPLETDVLNVAKDAYLGLAKLAEAVVGSSPLLVGFGVTPTSPASGTVVIAPGQIYSQQPLDATAYSSLGTDTTSVIKQGLMLAPYTPLASLLPAPTSGQSINYLVQVGYQSADGGPVVLPYYNSANPTMAWSGPGGDSSSQATVRVDQAVVSIVAGVAAATGTQTTPAPSSGCVGAWVVTVTSGLPITSGNIAVYSDASFLGNQPAGFSLNTLAPLASPAFTGNPTAPTQGAGDNSSKLASTAYVDAAAQKASGAYASDTGAANALVLTLNPVPASQAALIGQPLRLKVANTVTGSCTLNVNGLGALAIVHGDGSSIGAGEIAAGAVISVIYDGTHYQLQSLAFAPAPAAILQSVYPVGSVYLSTSASNPASTIGFGSWTQIAQGRALLGVGTGTDINGATLAVTEGAAGDSQGEYKHRLAPAEIPDLTIGNSEYSYNVAAGGNAIGGFPNGGTTTTNNTSGSSLGAAHNNIPPYFGVYVWTRTA